MPDFDDVLRASVETHFDGWLPTPENINALPEPLRQFIHDIQTQCDPAGETQSRVLAEENVKALGVKVGELESQLDQANYELGQREFEVKSSFDRGWEKGGEAMRAAIIREVAGGK